MKKVLLAALILIFPFAFISAQSKKAEKEAEGIAKFEKAKAAIEAKEFVVVPDSYEKSDGSPETNTDEANFLSFEDGSIFLQGMIICGNSYTNKTAVNSFDQKLDKKGNLSITMQVSGSAITARIEIQMRKGGNYADIIVTPTKGVARKFSGEIVPKSEAKYYKRPNVV
ncbi:MAG: hypothetical protein A2X19_04100 [Bacteroidetes bacterium GWE2_39_28]|nr:MAG: hypothetical protein A2X19_04100 [Bacteroidetes bacterium GWE2_39_28]OFY14797.1 MAG: hypothetical protein A2X16_05420 [Bacteroidetes bacterium GWF2_39_10]OFZ07313.1 MAG: hypothetical protein A2322_04340 [Bacteroidetes bacterium RIFOXYB2_FULL_39_7]OFZ12081.1 MAG: hypothetical protein A2465_09650 [Bacteroidetes bacterium RIFOXYC2_FULL_39_11]HCT93276.1 hypothetical protein [Rikenellaceae bacterium]